MGEKAALMASMHTILQCIIENHDAEEELFQQHLRVHRMAAEALQQHLSTVRAVEGAVLHFDRDQLWDHTRSFSQLHQRMNVIVEKAQVAMATIAMADHLNTDLSFTRNWTLPRTEAVWASMLELDNWDDARFRGSFRMSRETFDAIAEEISPIIQRQNTVMRRAIPVKKRLALTLYKLAFNLSYLPLSTTFGVGKSTACEIFRDTVRALNHLYLADVIKVGDEEKNIQGFRELGFPYVGASLDSSYIRILAPEQRGPEYHNQKCFYRMVLQAVVDAKGRFMDVYTGLSGKGRDSRVFWNSPVAEKLSKGTFFSGPPVMLNGVSVRPLVLGSQSFAPQPWLLAPFHSPKTSKEKNFNYYHSRARLQAERAFERLKSRWCSLHSLLDVEDDLIADVIVVCCVLHNICESRGDVLLQDNPHLPGPGAESDALPVEPETEQPGQQPPSPRSEAALRCEAQAVHAAIADFIWDHNPHVSCG